MSSKIKLSIIFTALFIIFFAHQSLAAETLFNLDFNTISLWRFDDSSGSLVTDETGVNNGAAIGTTIVDGKFGKARYFNGVSDYLRVPDNPSLDNLSQITIETWVYPQGFDLSCWALSEGLVIKGDASDFYASNAYGIEMVRNYDTSCVNAYSFRNIRFGIYFGTAGVSSLEHDPNQWYYVVGTFDGSKARIYINGVEESSGIFPARIIANSRDLYINHHTWNNGIDSSQRMQGLIDEIRISKIARSAEEIAYYYNLAINQPPTLSNLNQYKSDGVTPIAEGAITTEDAVILSANASSSSGLPVKLEAELKPISESFTGQANLISDFATSSLLMISTSTLPDGQYHWQARAVNSQGVASNWQEFGTPGNVDFEVKLPLSYKAANLAKQLINYPYLLGGKGWDYNQSEFVASNFVKTGYNYWNQAIGSEDFGAGLDCSGLIMWAYDRSFDPTKSRFNNFVKADGADEQYRYNTTSTMESDLKPGDVMFFDFDSNGFIDHVAMYVGESGNYDMINPANPNLGIVGRFKNDLKQPSTGFIAFKRVTSALPLFVLVTAHSPVDLVMTDPDGFTIISTTTIPSDEEYLREIPGVLYYSEMERGTDGQPIDQVYSYTAKTGDYIIKVLPAASATPTSTYTLDFSTPNQSITLAQDVPISQIPVNGYGVITSVTGTVSLFTPVSIDIKPGSYSNNINLKSNGVVPVAILGSTTFDVHKIDPATIKFTNAPVKLKNNGQPMVSFEDVNGDGFTDMVVQVNTKDLKLSQSDTKASVEGKLFNETIIKGSDSVRIVP